MATPPKVSIIVPVHNAVATIDTCVQSILSQNYPNIECVLVENGSSDASEDICKRYSEADERVRFAVSLKSGVSEARNLGLSIATGDIIGFCDADDFLEPEAVATVVSAFAEYPDVIGVFGAFYVGLETPTGLEKRYRGVSRKTLSAEQAIGLTIAHNNVMGSVWNKYYRADAVKDVLFDASLSHSEDTHFNVKLLSRSTDQTILLITEPLYCYVQCAQSVTHQPHRLFDENEELKYIVALKKILTDCTLTPHTRSLVRMRIAVLAMDHLHLDAGRHPRAVLKKEIVRNLPQFLRHITKFHFKKNCKRLVKTAILFLK